MKISNCIAGVSVLIIMLSVGCGKEKAKSIAKFTVNSESVDQGQSVQFTNASENASFYQWTFGDGTYAVTKSPSHVFATSGSFKVKLVAIGDGSCDSIFKTIKVSNVTVTDGVGISEVKLNDTWQTVSAKFPMVADWDTVEYYADEAAYLHTYMYNSNVALYFFTTSKKISNSDQLIMIRVFNSYNATTSKGIRLGDLISKVKSVYGIPTKVIQGDGYSHYLYQANGIFFYDAKDAGVVNMMTVISPSYKKSGLKSAKALEIKHVIESRKWFNQK